MDARTLAVSAGAGPKIVEQPRIGQSIIEAHNRDRDRRWAKMLHCWEHGGTRNYVPDPILLWSMEVSGVADIIRKGGRITSKDYVNAEVDHSEFDAWCANHPYTVTSPEMDRAVQNLIGRMDAALTIVRPYPPQ